MGENYSKLSLETSNNTGIIMGTGEYYVVPNILMDLNIDVIVCCLPGNITEYKKRFANKINEINNTNYSTDSIEINDNFLHYPLEDNSDYRISLFSKNNVNIIYVIDWMYNKISMGKNILVHCDMGLTRSPSVVCAYLMKYGTIPKTPKKMSFNDSYTLIKKCRNNNEKKRYVDIRIFTYELQMLEEIIFQNLHVDSEI